MSVDYTARRHSSMFDPESFELEMEDAGGFQIVNLGPVESDEGAVRKKTDAANSYRLEPTVEVKPDKMTAVIRRVLEDQLTEKKYEGSHMSRLTADISHQIRKELKALRYHRYRFVCYVSIGERKDQGIEMACRYLWNPEHDHFAHYTFENRSLFATAIVFAVYKD